MACIIEEVVKKTLSEVQEKYFTKEQPMSRLYAERFKTATIKLAKNQIAQAPKVYSVDPKLMEKLGVNKTKKLHKEIGEYVESKEKPESTPKTTNKVTLQWDAKAGTIVVPKGKTTTSTVEVSTLEDLIDISEQYHDIMVKEHGVPWTDWNKHKEYFKEAFKDIQLDKEFKPVKVKFNKTVMIGKEDALGRANSDGTIEINTSRVEDAYPLKVVLHEYAHILTLDQIVNNPDSPIVKKLTELYDRVKDRPELKMANGDPMYGTKNVAEFVAETLSSLAFQTALNKIPSGNTIVNNVRELFKKLLAFIKQSDGPTALDEVLDLAAQLEYTRGGKKVSAAYTGDTLDSGLHKKIEKTLRKLYPEINLRYTEDDIKYVDSNGNVMNQKEATKAVNYRLKVVDTLYDIGTAKPSKHGGTSQPVRSTIRLNSKENPNIEANLTKFFAGKGVSKEQIEYMFEYMRQNGIQEIDTLELAEKLLLSLTQNVEINEGGIVDKVIYKQREYPSGDRWAIGSYKYLLNELKIKRALKLSSGKDLYYISASSTDRYTGKTFAIEEEVSLVDNTKRGLLDKVLGKNKQEKVVNTVYSINGEEVTKEQFKEDIDVTTKEIVIMKKSDKYKDLTVPGGTNYTEVEISTPNIKADIKGHAAFATDKGIGWYRVDTEVKGQEEAKMPNAFVDKYDTKWEKKDGVWYLTYPGDATTKRDDLSDAEARKSYYETTVERNDGTTGTPTKTLRVLEMQSDMFQKGKDKDFSKKDSIESGDAFLDFDNAVESNTNVALDKAFHQILNTDNKWVRFFIKSIIQSAQKNGYEKIVFPTGNTVAKIEGYTEAQNSKAIMDFYQVRVQNTLKKEYGKDKVKTVTDEHGNTWFELELDNKRDSQTIMLQQQDGRIKGQANIEAGTVLINSLLQSQDTLPHEYAHHYIAWFRDTPIVQEAIKKWGSEEALVQAIGEQVVKQKGEAWNWWKKFTAWLQGKFDKLSEATKEELRDALTDAFLTREDLKALTSNKEVEAKYKPKEGTILDNKAEKTANNLTKWAKECAK